MLNKTQIIFSALLFLPVFVKTEFASNKFDPQCIASFRGISGKLNFGESSASKKKQFVSFTVTPMMVNSSTSWNQNKSYTSKYGPDNGKYNYGVKEEGGFWNAGGIFYGFADQSFASAAVLDASPTEKARAILYYAPLGSKLTATTSSPSETIGTGFGNLPDGQKLISPASWTASKYDAYYKAFLKTAFAGISDENLTNLSVIAASEADLPSWPTLSTENLKNNLLSKESLRFQTPGETDNSKGLIKLEPALEKKGVRLQAGSNLFDGISLYVKGGFADVRVYATAPKALATGEPLPITSDFGQFKEALKSLDLSIDDYHFSGLEDTCVSLHAGQPLDLRDNDGDLIGNLVPFASISVWLPTSKDYNEAKGNKFALYTPLGNEGHYGIDGQMGALLEVKDSFSLSAGAGVTFFNEKTIKDFRMKNDKNQTGLYPFMIDIKRKPGRNYYGFASLKVMDFESSANFFADVWFLSHNKDSILTIDSDSARNDAFETGRIKTETESEWYTMDFNIGANLNISEDMCFGGGFTSNILGKSTPRNRTIYFSIGLSF